MKIKPAKIELFNGYTDKKGKIHKQIEISKLIKAGEFFFLEATWGNQSPTTLTAYLLSHAITKFGKLEIPVSTNILLELYKTDLEDLVAIFNSFTEQNGTPILIDEKTVKLVFGLEKDGTIYDLAEFGKLTTGKDVVEAEMKELSGNREAVFLAGKEIVRLKQSNGDLVLEGELNLETIGELYLIDALGIVEQSKIWNQYQYIVRKD